MDLQTVYQIQYLKLTSGLPLREIRETQGILKL